MADPKAWSKVILAAEEKALVYGKPHPYDPDPLGTTKTPPCRCGMTKAYRGHQRVWWRVLHPGAKWR